MCDPNPPDAFVHPIQSPSSKAIPAREWFVMMLLMAIPLVNLILLLIWAFDEGADPNRSNWAKAALVWMVVVIVLSICFLPELLAIHTPAAGVAVAG